MRNDMMANHPRVRSRSLMPDTAGCVNRGRIQSPSKKRTINSDNAAETVVAPSAITIPTTGPNNSPLENVMMVRGSGSCVIRTYKTKKTTANHGPAATLHERSRWMLGTSMINTTPTNVSNTATIPNCFTLENPEKLAQASPQRVAKKSHSNCSFAERPRGVGVGEVLT